MKEYDEETLKKVQCLERLILQDVLDICREHALTCFGLCGTVIGAVRHGGFIPWDDDIDVGISRKDYEKLEKIIEEQYADKYVIVNAEHFKNYPLMTTQITLKGTKFVTDSLKNVKCDFGIYLDVFIFDNVPDDDRLMKKQAWRAWFWAKLLMMRQIAFPILPFDGIKRKMVYFVCAVVHIFMVVLRISPRWLYRMSKKYSCKYNDMETNRMAFLCETTPFSNMLDRRKAFPMVEMEFEGLKLKVPKDYDEQLRAAYGDYMQLPPVEKRKNHFPHHLDFGGY